MRLVLGLRIPSAGGGVRTYTETTAVALQKAGHDITVYSPDSGEWAGWFGDRGIRTVGKTADLPQQIDFFLPQDLPTAYDLLEARPDVPQAFTWHSHTYDVDLSPNLEGSTAVIFTHYTSALTRADALSFKPPIVEVGQPINLSRFSPHGPIGERPTKAAAISNYLVGDRRAILVEACEKAGIELTIYGVNEPQSSINPEIEMNAVDIVFGKGRVIAEALACGRAAYLYDFYGTDGWITADNFAEFAGSGFAGYVTEHSADPDRIAADLTEGYKPTMGMVNRDLALSRFTDWRHAAQIVTTLEKHLGERPAHNDSAFELARITRTSWAFESELHILRHKMNVLGAEQLATNERLAETEGKLNQIVESKRWRYLTAALAPLDRLRGRS